MKYEHRKQISDGADQCSRAIVRLGMVSTIALTTEDVGEVVRALANARDLLLWASRRVTELPSGDPR